MKARSLLACTLVLLGACTQPAQRELPAHTVARGDTLYSIAWRYQLNYRDLSAWNAIPAPYTIYPGQRIVLTPASAAAADPDQTSLLRLPPAPPPAPVNNRAGEPATGTALLQTPAAPVLDDDSESDQSGDPPVPAADRSTPVPRPGTWRWPTKGKVVKQFDTGKQRLLGVAIAGVEGQPIRAAAGGRVVYSGRGIPSYGRLLIVKHDAAFLSAYAHNRRLLVREGAQVRAGQLIAEMGRDSDNQQVLHFEIRKHGKPVDPLNYLAR